MQNTYGSNNESINPLQKDLFDMWKLANGLEVRLLYDLINIG